jgi:hypothetical protein
VMILTVDHHEPLAGNFAENYSHHQAGKGSGRFQLKSQKFNVHTWRGLWSVENVPINIFVPDQSQSGLLLQSPRGVWTLEQQSTLTLEISRYPM